MRAAGVEDLHHSLAWLVLQHCSQPALHPNPSVPSPAAPPSPSALLLSSPPAEITETSRAYPTVSHAHFGPLQRQLLEAV